MKDLPSTFPFAEYGKIFRPGGNATDFEILDRSDDKTARSLYDFYNKNFAVYSVTEKLPFTFREPGFGNFTAALAKDPLGGKNYIFIQLQQRREAEPLLKQNIPLGQFANNRPYNHARFTVVSPESIMIALSSGARKEFYTDLLIRSSDGKALLRDYYSDDKSLSKLLQLDSEAYKIKYTLMNDTPTEAGLLQKLTNILNEYCIKKTKTETIKGKAFPAVVLVAPGLDVESRLRLMQEAQARLFKYNDNVITFTLDYISEHLFQFYFCTENPPNWMFTNPLIFSASELSIQSTITENYYQKVEDLSPRQIEDPLWNDLKIRKAISLDDAKRFYPLLKLDAGPVPNDFPELFLRNLAPLGRTHVESLIRRVFIDEEGKQLIDDILVRAPENLNSELLIPLYQAVFNSGLEYLKGDLARFFHHYQQVKEIDRSKPEMQEFFPRAVESSLSSSLDTISGSEQENLFRELILLSNRNQITFLDGTPMLDAVFSRPGLALFDSINSLMKDGIWNPKLTKKLQGLEHLEGDLAKFFHHYQQIKENEPVKSILRELFKKTIESSISNQLETVAIDERANLFCELILLGRPEPVVFRDRITSLDAVFSRPGLALFETIQTLNNNGNWDQELTDKLKETIIQRAESWDLTQLRELKNKTDLSLPVIPLLLLTRLVRNMSVLDEFKRLSLPERSKSLFDMLDTESNVEKHLLPLFPQAIQPKLREILLEVCALISLQNLRFASWWLPELSAAGNPIFRADYRNLIIQLKSNLQGDFKLETSVDRSIYFLLTGKSIEGQPRSLREACQLANLEEQYEIILEIWVEQKISVPTPDIIALVDSLGTQNSWIASNGYLVGIVINQPAKEQTQEICGLPVETALKWLKLTEQHNLRRFYQVNGDDQLYLLLSEIHKPTQEFALYMVAKDPATRPLNFSWSEYSRKIDALNKKFKEHGMGEGLADEFVRIVKLFRSPNGKDAAHQFGLRRLIERNFLVDQMTAEMDIGEQEIRLILHYALSDGMNITIKKLARKVLVENRNFFFRSLSTLRNDEVWTLHCGYALIKSQNEDLKIKVDDQLINALEIEGMRRINSLSPSEIGNYL